MGYLFLILESKINLSNINIFLFQDLGFREILIIIYNQLRMTEKNNITNTAEENIKKLALDMLKRNIDIKMIIQATGLSKEQIQKLNNNK